jgi:hypothetical protein
MRTEVPLRSVSEILGGLSPTRNGVFPAANAVGLLRTRKMESKQADAGLKKQSIERTTIIFVQPPEWFLMVCDTDLPGFENMAGLTAR